MQQEFDLHIHTSTINRHLTGNLLTVKKLRVTPSSANSEDNKQKRATYVRNIMELVGRQYHIYYQDETNINLFCRRTQGRALRGQPCQKKAPNSRGPNIHCWGLMNKEGIVFKKICRGSIKSERNAEFMSQALDTIIETHRNLQKVVIVIESIDNVPSHSKVEETVAQQPRFTGVTILRLAPYSAPLNPIEYL